MCRVAQVGKGAKARNLVENPPNRYRYQNRQLQQKCSNWKNQYLRINP
jgi:hypothetical protein